MSVRKIEFTELEKEISKTGRSHLDLLGSESGRVYVVAIARDGCPACDRQKPKMNELSKTTEEKYGRRVVFIRIRVKHPTENDNESLRSKAVLRHYFYPTNLILLKTKDRGAIEYYRNVSPRMSELRRSIETAVDIVKMLEKT